jgi:superfamily II DNA or RNA helicase
MSNNKSKDKTDDDSENNEDNQENKEKPKQKSKSKDKPKAKGKEKIELKPHQLIPINYMKDPENRGLLLYHSTGSGKTITALMAMYQFSDKHIIIIGPKSSRKAFYDDIKKLELDASRFKLYTFAKIKKLIKETNIDVLSDFYVIIDEAHNLRNETKDNMLLIAALELVQKIILLTATPVINYLNDLAVLVNIVQNRAILPTDIKTFNASYYDEMNGTILNRDILIDKLKDSISYYDRKYESEDYPESDTIYMDVEMNNEQLDEYRFYMKKFLYDEIIGSQVYSIDFENINPRKKNFFLSGTRQLSNTINGSSDFPKIQKMYKQIKKEAFPCVVYSNYLKNGVFALTPLLERDNITYKTITGDSTDEKIDRIVDYYNRGRYQVLLITSAGSESLDLKNTRQIHIMEPHWNESRIKQVIGRVIRYKSHNSLPFKERHVTIYRWCSVFPELIHNKSADQYLIELSKKKDNIFSHFNTIIKEVAIEHFINKRGGSIKTNESNETKLINTIEYHKVHAMYSFNRIKYSEIKYL